MDKNIDKLDNKVFKAPKKEKKQISEVDLYNQSLEYASKHNITTKQALEMITKV